MNAHTLNRLWVIGVVWFFLSGAAVPAEEGLPGAPAGFSPVFSIISEVEEATGHTNDSSGTTVTENTVNENHAGNFLSSIFGSISENVGIVSINQSSGSIVNQSNLRAFFFSTDPDSLTEFRLAKISAVDANTIVESGAKQRRDVLEDSFWDNTMLLGVNQTAGNFNQQSNTAVVVVGGLAVLTDEELGHTRASNVLDSEDNAQHLEDLITDCFSNSQGIFQVTQAAGNFNIQRNNLTLSFREMDF